MKLVAGGELYRVVTCCQECGSILVTDRVHFPGHDWTPGSGRDRFFCLKQKFQISKHFE